MAEFNTTKLPVHIAELKFALDNVPAYVYIKNELGHYVYANKLTLDLFACSAQELQYKTDTDFFPRPDAKKLAKIDKRVLRGERTREEVELTFPGGHTFIFWEVKTPIFCDSEPNKVIGILGIATDITERKYHEQQLLYAASTDPLTELLNRRYFYIRLSLALEMSKRDQSYGAVIFIDLNKFKKLNDQYGHNTGDAYLVEIANRMKAAVREKDCLARIGGDEFIVLLEGLGRDEQTAKHNAHRVADKLQTAIEIKFIHQDINYKGSASVGVTMFLGTQETADEIVAQADQHMYMIKHTLTD
ncbi:GGDEF domain-containing protein [Pseudoalteromonas sp. MEBiC 03485]|uniref:sensor domain-containing diguanylate cyclase n=1 Tax=Pseudoalteromonas sp. MEBiC 03485 TaxID=2571103 RepID=UPI001021E65B|nr:GGDEF domain-containing protein [Pseudoalteromonas sp. MEBiC 03485]RZD20221.1 GGDEF domain-containing protein [Pseudoalteromonas sp. MEBiC 03485]